MPSQNDGEIPTELDADAYRALADRQRTKYGNRKIEIDGHTFDSLLEAGRYGQLKLMEAAGAIADLELQPRFDLVVNDHKISRYTADFRYRDTATGDVVIEDVKGGNATKTRAYVMRRKLMKALYGIDITEVE